MSFNHINPLQWNQALGVARASCARFFRDGGAPADALRAFGIAVDDRTTLDWGRAVEAITDSLCAAPMKRAA
jgi:hypothetical protein